VRKSEREKQSFSTRQYQEHVFQFDLEKHINLKTLYLFSASVELQSFRFLNPKTPFLAQYSDPTVLRSTVKFKSTSIGFRQTTSQSKGHLSLLSLLSFSFKRFPESSTLSKAEILNIRTTSHKVIILGNHFGNPDYTTPNRSRKRTAIRSSSF
jgi:hypothetical protein